MKGQDAARMALPMGSRKRGREDHDGSTENDELHVNSKSEGSNAPHSRLRKGMVILKGFLSLEEQEKLAVRCGLRVQVSTLAHRFHTSTLSSIAEDPTGVPLK